MTNRGTSQKKEIGLHLDRMTSLLPALERAQLASDHNLTKEGSDCFRRTLESLQRALKGGGLLDIPVFELAELQTLVTELSDALPTMLQDLDSNQKEFSTHVENFHQKAWSLGVLNPESIGASSPSVPRNLSRTVISIQNQLKELGDISALHSRFTTLLNSASQSVKTLERFENLMLTWHEEIKAGSSAIDGLKETTLERITLYDKEISERNEIFERNQKRIDEQFRLASSGALAKAFGERRKWLLVGKLGWGLLAVLSYAFAVAFAMWLSTNLVSRPEPEDVGVQLTWLVFTVRLSVGIPIGFFVWFATVQYSKASRMQEAYAFKSTVASSFDAYRELVGAITKDPDLTSRPEFANFITKTIGYLYSPPQVEGAGEDQPPHIHVIDEASTLLKEIGDLASKFR